MPLSWSDLILILAVVVVIFAAGKLPEISGGLRRTIDNLSGRQSVYSVELEPPARGSGDAVENGAEAKVDKADPLE